MALSTGSASMPLNELWDVVPRFVDRTTRQVELSRVLLGHVPCIGERMISLGLARRADGGGMVDTGGPGKSAAGPVSMTATSDTDRSDRAAGGDSTTDGSTTPQADRVPTGATQTPPGSLPDEADLAIPQYDSLAASQVIPRLEMLKPDDLRHILRYEESKRNRQTIVHKVGQLLATTTE